MGLNDDLINIINEKAERQRNQENLESQTDSIFYRAMDRAIEHFVNEFEFYIKLAVNKGEYTMNGNRHIVHMSIPTAKLQVNECYSGDYEKLVSETYGNDNEMYFQLFNRNIGLNYRGNLNKQCGFYKIQIDVASTQISFYSYRMIDCDFRRRRVISSVLTGIKEQDVYATARLTDLGRYFTEKLKQKSQAHGYNIECKMEIKNTTVEEYLHSEKRGTSPRIELKEGTETFLGTKVENEKIRSLKHYDSQRMLAGIGYPEIFVEFDYVF